MLTLLTLTALTLTQAPAPAAQPAAPAGKGLTLTNVRSTYGSLGGTRPATPMMPGDVLFVAFDIDGVTIDADSKVSYSMAMEVSDAAGKAIYKQAPATKAEFVPLGGGRLPGKAYITVGLDQAPGTYNLKVTVTDLVSKAVQSLDYKFEVIAKDFGIVAVYTSVDERGEVPASTTVAVGQQVHIQFAVVGFSRGATKQPNVSIEMLPLDDKGNPTMPKPSTFKLDAGVDEKDPGVTVRFLLPVTRPGNFTVRLKATDAVSGKSSSFNLPLVAVSPSN